MMGRAGRGGMMMGRGGRGRGRGGMIPRGPPNYTQYLNNHLCRRFLSYLTVEERKVLGQTYPRFRVPDKKQQQQQGGAGRGGGRGNGAGRGSSKEDSEQKSEIYPLEEEKEAEEPKPSEGEDGKNPEEKKEEPLESEGGDKKYDEVCTASKKENTGPSISDPHTLLARLNSKRLYKRIQYYQKEKKDYKDAYILNKTTEQIANYEWQQIIDGYNVEAKKRAEAAQAVKEAEEKGEEVEEQQEEGNIKVASPIPSSCELLLFSPCPRAVAVLASYPRSGNSLLRNLYERTTLRVTGSDMWGGLTKHDLVGEAATQTNCVQFVKTHFPERRGNPPFPVNRAVLLVRNPYDAMESYFNLMMTGTHTTSLTEEQREKNFKLFAEMARKEILVWRDFHEYWLQQNIPLLVIRYEDLIRYTDKVIASVLSFVLELKNPSFFESRIDRCIREEQIERLGSYKPRSGGIGKSLQKYTPELLQEINQGIISTMTKFGYKEMLVPDPSSWKLEPLDQYAVYIPPKTQSFKPLVINGKNLVRGPKRHTNWMQLRKQTGMAQEKKAGTCSCYKCVRGRM